VHGKDKNDAKNVLTLDEALEQKKVVVYETSQVDQLEDVVKWLATGCRAT
jgi:hypothetical protein